MYVRGGMRARHLFNDSWQFLLMATGWSVLVVYLHEFLEYKFIAMPIVPVTTIGIAVSLYLGFKSTSAYQRWWEARILWGGIVNISRNWANHVCNLIYAEDRDIEPVVRDEMIDRHLAWVNALAHQLRKTTRLKESRVTHIFDHRRVFEHAHFHPNPESYRRHLSREEADLVDGFVNPATHILRRQGDRLRELARNGLLDSYRHAQMMSLLGAMYDCQGKCERIKNTPFPRQVANFGLVFTWIFIILLPLAFVNVFEAATDFNRMSDFLAHQYMVSLVPFAVLISWVFFIMEKVSDSTEDPFEGGVTDVSISALCRTIEIDLKQIEGATDVPEPLQPIDGVLY